MATFLSLCQAVARESGTVPTIGDPQSTLGQTGRLARIVLWVQDAYRDIQVLRGDWRWLRDEFSGQTIAATQEYDAAALGIANRFSDWVYRGERGSNHFSIFLTSEGQSDEGLLQFIDWDQFRRLAMIGEASTTQGKPIYVTVDDAMKLRLYPTPDAAYTVRGRYVKAPQELTADGDTPEMPEQFHDAIKWRALMLLAQFDEAPAQMPAWSANYFAVLSSLKAQQIGRVGLAGPLF